MIQLLDKGFISLEDSMGNDLSVVEAARTSHLGEGSKGAEKDEGLIRYLTENRHTSPFEHVVFKFLIKCPLFVRSQWHRHRTWSYNEVSRRYTSEQIEFHHPAEWRIQDTEDKQSSSGATNSEIQKYADDFLQDILIESLGAYNWMLSKGIAREQARMVLPQNMYTQFYGTVNLHNLFHFLELRNSPHAQEEIRVYAEAIEQLIKPIVPWSYNAWKSLRSSSM